MGQPYLSFLGRITVSGNLNYFLSHCRKRLIDIVSSGPESSFSFTGTSSRHKEYGPAVSDFLDNRRLRVSRENHVPEFGQPLRNLEEAEEFIRRHSPSGYCCKPEDLQKKLTPIPGGGWYLLHKEHICIFVIDKEV